MDFPTKGPRRPGLRSEPRVYVQSPGSLYNLNPSNLVGDAETGIEVNTACIKVSDTLSSVVGSYLNKNDAFYFGWDPEGETYPDKDSCCIQVFGYDECAIEAEAEDYETYCQVRGGTWQFPFDVVAWQVTNCVAMFKAAG